MNVRLTAMGLALALSIELGGLPSAARAAVNTPSPPPVTATPTREGLQTGAEDRTERRKRPKGTKKAPARKKPTTSHSGHDDDRRQPRDNPPSTPEDDFNLNIGICGRRAPDGTIPGPTRCQPFEPDEPLRRTAPPQVVAPPRPEDVTWEQVLSETKTVLFPKLSVHVQPKDRTLVNLDTIVYTDDRGVTTVRIELLDFPVVVKAVPTSFTWHFGDGTSKTTDSPGKPYPSKEITHKFLQRGDMKLSVTVSYAASFAVAGGAPQYVGEVPITGPATALQVREAVPVLVDPPR